MANIRLNFLSLVDSDFSFDIYRKTKQEGEVKDDTVYQARLLINHEAKDKNTFLISTHAKEGYEVFNVSSYDSINLTKRITLTSLYDMFISQAIPYPISYQKKFGGDLIEITVDQHVKGRKLIVISSYYLEEQRRFGFLVDYRFSINKGIPFDKEMQRLSLSLDSQYRSNKNFYADKFHIVSAAISNIFSIVKCIKVADNLIIGIAPSLTEIPCFQLNKKEYIFNNNKTSYSQFQGIKNYGPYQNIDEEVEFVFLFEEKYKSFANEIYLSLVGKSNPGTFPGFSSMFKVQFGLNNIKQVKIANYDTAELLNAIDQVKTIRANSAGKKVIVIFIEDYLIDNDISGASDIYYFLKYNFIKEDIPLQVINYRRLSEKNALKWSTSNIALQIFSKLGGIPWIVKPSNNNCLILGIGSSHFRNSDTGQISKFFAYTVCLDSSGLYKKLEVLADETNEEHYLEKLQANLVTLLKSDKFQDYKSCVLHLPFKIKYREIDALSKAINQIKEMEFVAIKINTDNKFFGYSFHNTYVPYESTFIKLSHSEYLVWFEGLQYGKEIVDKRLSNPVHIQFLNISENRHVDERKYLQDVLNLSGANWRGFNAKSIPISIYYSQIIAEYTKSFESIAFYNENSLSNERPWFL
jgi:hypothetical protein